MGISGHHLHILAHRAWHGSDGHAHKAGDLHGSALARHRIGDRCGLDAEDLADQRRKAAHRATRCSSENCLNGVVLLLIRALVDVERNLPVAIDHRTRRPCDQSGVEPIEPSIAERPGIDVEGESHLASTFSRHRCEWCSAEKIQGQARCNCSSQNTHRRTTILGCSHLPRMFPPASERKVDMATETLRVGATASAREAQATL